MYEQIDYEVIQHNFSKHGFKAHYLDPRIKQQINDLQKLDTESLKKFIEGCIFENINQIKNDKVTPEYATKVALLPESLYHQTFNLLDDSIKKFVNNYKYFETHYVEQRKKLKYYSL